MTKELRKKKLQKNIDALLLKHSESLKDLKTGLCNLYLQNRTVWSSENHDLFQSVTDLYYSSNESNKK